MTLSVTVLGCSGSYAGPGGACSGYLVRGGGTALWLDAGPGTLANLQRHLDLDELAQLADGLLTQGTVLGCVNELSDPRDVVLEAGEVYIGKEHRRALVNALAPACLTIRPLVEEPAVRAPASLPLLALLRPALAWT